jgi:hypothetical protein
MGPRAGPARTGGDKAWRGEASTQEEANALVQGLVGGSSVPLSPSHEMIEDKKWTGDEGRRWLAGW